MFARFGELSQDSGNVSYGVEVGGQRYFVKTAGEPDDPKPFLPHDERVALLRNAADLASAVSHPALPQLHTVIESPIGPALVYDWVPGELLGVPRALRDDPTSSFCRFRALPVERILAALDVVYDAHRALADAGWIAVDFYDGSLLYDFDASRIAIVDVDNYNRGPFRNTMGRMFGSTRFMSPEEFEKGALIDERTTVFVMGRAALVFLSDATTGFRGSRSLHDVVTIATRPDPTGRFADVRSFADAWREARRS